MEQYLEQLKADNERLRAENEDIRQHCITHDTCKIVIAQAKKDTAREILQLIEKRHGHSCSEYYPTLIECNSIDLDKIAKEYGIELKDGEE